MSRTTPSSCRRRALVCAACAWLLARPAAALDVQVKTLHAAASAVQATIELRDVVPDRFRKTLEEGGVLHLRVQAELWQSRPVWDRLVYPAIVRVLRLDRAPQGPLALVLDLGKPDRVAAAQRYYVHIVATLGTLADRDVDDLGDAVFGRESEPDGLGSLGRLLIQTALKISDYMQSVTAEATGKRMSGADILKP